MLEARDADTIRWLHVELGALLRAECCNTAAILGDFELLDWLRERDVPVYTAGAAREAVKHGQLAMLQYLDSINTVPWDSDSVRDILVAAVESGNIEACEWLHTRFPAVALASREPWQRYGDDTRLTLPILRWSIAHGINWHQLASRGSRVKLRCWHLTKAFSCEAFHWAHQNGLSDCTCPAHGDQDEDYEEREHVMEDCYCFQNQRSSTSQ